MIGSILFTFKSFVSGQEQGFKGLITATGRKEPNYEVVKSWAASHSDGPKVRKAEES